MTHRHLSDEQLSAHLDGESGRGPAAAAPDRPATNEPVPGGAVSESEVGNEIAGCPTCRERSAALSRARALVRLPVDPVLPSMRAAAVASALAEGSESEPAHPPATVLSYPTAGKQRAPYLWTGAAAAVAVLLVVGVSLGLSHSSSTPSASAPPTTSASKTHGALRAPTTFGAKKSGLTDLGSLSSVTALKAGVNGALGPEKSTDQTLSGSAPAANGAPTAAPSSSSFSSVPEAFSSCVTAAEKSAGGTGPLQLVATATYVHTPALVVVVDVSPPTSAASGPVAVVVARSGCRLLARTML